MKALQIATTKAGAAAAAAKYLNFRIISFSLVWGICQAALGLSFLLVISLYMGIRQIGQHRRRARKHTGVFLCSCQGTNHHELV